MTGEVPKAVDSVESHSGLTHPYTIENRYYNADLDIWIDEFDSEEGVDEWVTTFCSDEAKEVRDAIGGVVYTFDPNSSTWYKNLEKISKFIELLDEEMWEGVSLAVSRGNYDQGDELMDFGLEHVDQAAETVNKFGERDGLDRIKEALETYEWPTRDDEKAKEQGADGEEDNEEFNEQSIIEDIKKLKYNDPLLRDEKRDQEGSEQDVENLEEFMEKLKNARDSNKDISNDERQKLSEDLADELLRIL